MGIDLMLLPYLVQKDHYVSYSILSMSRQTAFFEVLDSYAMVKGREIEEQFYSYQPDEKTAEDTMGETSVDKYDTPLKTITPAEFLEAVTLFGDELYPLNKAILAYVQNLPDDWRIALYWH